MSARYRALNCENGPVVVCEDDEPGTVMAMTGRQQDAEEIAAALNSYRLLFRRVARLSRRIKGRVRSGRERAPVADEKARGRVSDMTRIFDGWTPIERFRVQIDRDAEGAVWVRRARLVHRRRHGSRVARRDRTAMTHADEHTWKREGG